MNRKNEKKKNRKRSTSSSKSSLKRSRSKSKSPAQNNNRQFRVNKFALGSMLFENRRTNDRMDKTEVDEATKKLQKVDSSGRQAMLMSTAINLVQQDQKREDYTIELVDGQYIKIPKPYACGFKDCSMRFTNAIDLQQHLKDHERVQTQKNSQRAQKFLDQFL